MSDRLTPLTVERLLTWMLCEERQKGAMFGIPQELFFTPSDHDPFRLTRYGRTLETPLGVAAGPHTQLAQNIISSWLTGARYVELKTVQTLDELEITRPCIDMEDEGYNCEWSQELKLDQSFDEYLKAWVLLHLLRHHFGWGDGAGDPGFIFNMSVGYNLEGILKPNVQAFLGAMENAEQAIAECVTKIAPLYSEIETLSIPGQISDNVTLSTMHGCPPDEIEKIGLYLIEERRLHTAIKMNPTLLGPDALRKILNEKLGYDAIVPDEAFEHDIQFEDAVEVIRSLDAAAKRSGVEFGLKLTNTLETMNVRKVFPEKEKMHYMSGRALHPISVAVAERLQQEFSGSLDLSFSAGADAFNSADLLAANLRPITVCTDLLKPGGYGRLSQYMEQIRQAMAEVGAESVEDFIHRKAGDRTSLHQAGLANLKQYAARVADNPVYHVSHHTGTTLKTHRTLDTFDCAGAPCVETCGVHQDIPEYLFWTAQGEYDKAWEVIARTNPMPRSTGMVCDHLCQLKCTRSQMDDPLRIRDIKRFIAEGHHGVLPKPAPANGVNVAVIGAGPSGLSCAYFLALAGFTVELYEGEKEAGGMVSGAIPAFRLTGEAVSEDIAGVEQLVHKVHTGVKVDRTLFDRLRDEFDYIFIGVGAQASKKLNIPGEGLDRVWDQITFLTSVRRGLKVELGQRVVIIGGGNSAMDAARTARRLVGTKGEVTVAYRRTRSEMPADRDEIRELLEEGATLMELVAPLEIVEGDGNALNIRLQKMTLGEPDSSGRPRPIPIEGKQFVLETDSVISAVGQDVVIDFLPDEKLKVDPLTGETQHDGVYAGGDAVRGAATLIKAIGDGRRIAEEIQRRAHAELGLDALVVDKLMSDTQFQVKQARRITTQIEHSRGDTIPTDFSLVTGTLTEQQAREEADRCLYCTDYCSICVAVCPNRANFTYEVEPVEYKLPVAVRVNGGVALEGGSTFRVGQTHQTLNVADFCNECGDCVTFCPTSGAPWSDKPRFYLDEAEFESAATGYHFSEGVLHARVAGERETLYPSESGGYVYETSAVRALIDPREGFVKEIQFHRDDVQRAEFQHAAEMLVLYRALVDHYLFGEPRDERVRQ
ncbi:MAG: putative selenate reductase subunit YgfK [bacterium]